ncbi:hypothetical protein [Pollutibacter soli]|uniref:hypothetical protein n=1 Tax=Pollutibacter soli TaxID=3034157 RepID=UPI0030133959
MNECYQIKSAGELSEKEIERIVDAWSIPEYNDLTKVDFAERFSYSEFHLLYYGDSISALARINFDFELEMEGVKYKFAELVGLVAVEKQKGRGTQLVKLIMQNMVERNIQAIGFCEKSLRGFYIRCELRIFEGKAKYLLEYVESKWIPSTDDDILEINLSSANRLLFESLNQNNPAFLYLA